MALDLICLGNLTIDDVVLPDHTHKLGCFGGDTIYSALGAACWSDSVKFVAPVGNDFPEENLAFFQKYGLDTRGLSKRDIPSIRNWVIYQDNNTRTWTLESNPDDFFPLSPTLADIPNDYLNAKAFMLLAMDLSSQENLAPHLRKHGLVGLDAQEDYIAGNQERILKLLKDVDIFLPSHEEVYRILGHHDYEKACREFADCGAEDVVIKMGHEGSLIYDRARDLFHHIPIYPTEVVDTTGAGDAYCGGFMAMYVRSGSLVDAGLAGSVSASFAVEDFGLTHLFNLDRAEVKERFTFLKKKLLAKMDN